MKPLRPQDAALELIRRQKRSSFADGSLLAPHQREAALDTSRFRAWPWGRRSGKTDLVERLLPLAALSQDRVQVYYVSTTKLRAAATVWDELKSFHREYSLPGQANEVLHSIRYPNGSRLWVTGVEHKKMADDLRGRKRVALWAIDECQDWPDDLLRYFYENVAFQSLADIGGSVVMSGTGGPPRGFWYDVSRDPAAWSLRSHSIFDNPFLKAGEAQWLVDKACKDRGCTIDDPSIQREFYGRFIADLTRQIFPFDASVNAYDMLPAGRWSHVIGADFGTVDATAAAVWGWSTESPALYLVERITKTGLGASGQVELVRGLMSKYDRTLVGVVGDPGGGGAALMVDLNRGQAALPVEAAEKAGKASACMLMRDALRTGMIKLPLSDAELADELQRPEWDPDNVGRAIRGHMPDTVDAMLYGFRKARALNWYSAPTPPQSDAEAAEREAQAYRDHIESLGDAPEWRQLQRDLDLDVF